MDSVLKFLIKFNTDASNLLSSTRRVTEQIGRIEHGAKRAGDAIRNAFSASSFRNALMDIPGMRFLTNPYTLVAAGIGAITNLGISAEKTAKSFDVLVGSQEQSAKLLESLGKFAADTPYSKLDLIQNAQSMLAFGVEAEKTQEYLQQLGDLAMGDANKLQSLALVFGQVKAAGTLNGGDLKQFINVGFNPLKELQAMTGKSYESLQELMSKGQITFDNVAQAIGRATGEGGQFHGMMDQLAETTGGKLSKTIGDLKEGIAGLFVRIQPAVNGLLTAFNGFIPTITSALGGLFDSIMDGINFVREWGAELMLFGGIILSVTAGVQLKTIAVAIYTVSVRAITAATNGWAGVQAMFNAVLSANPIGVVIMLIGALVSVGVYCWNKFAGFRAFMLTMWDVFKGFGDIIKNYVIDRIQSLLSGIGKLGEAMKLFFSGEWGAAASTAKEAVIDLSGYNAAKNALSSTKGLKDLAQDSWRKNLTTEDAKGAKDKSLQDIINGGISTPGLKGSQTEVVFGGGSGGGKSGKGGKSGEAIATGGQRNTQITMTIGKLIEHLNVSMMDKSDTADLERAVLQSVNRALAIATSTDR